MFEKISEKFQQIIRKISGYGILREENIEQALREVRIALLEADVNYRVVKDFIERVKSKALGQEVMESLTPGQHFIKIVRDELVSIMGDTDADLDLKGKVPVGIMLVGLQGSGKTTTCAKLAKLIKGKGRHPFLVPADVKRAAAAEQLLKLGEEIGVPVYRPSPGQKSVEVCISAINDALSIGCDIVIMDTAGRLHIDEELMEELKVIKMQTKPKEILLVADGMTGQDAVNIAIKFNEALDITGIILTKMDGDARGGAALSIRAVTGKSIKFIGTGEKLDALEHFYPDRMASRILGMGDVLSLIEKVQVAVDEKKARELEKKLKKAEFTLDDFKEQILSLKKMGSIEEILSMIPGVGRLIPAKNIAIPEKELDRTVAIINSMTKEERRNPSIINGSRRLRIAKGSGTTVQEVNRLLKNYFQIKRMMQKMKKDGIRGLKYPFKI